MNFRGPDFFLKHSVWGIELYAYAGNETVVKIPEGIESIDEYVFGNPIEPNTSIQKVIMPDTIRYVDERALTYCEALKEVEFSSNISTLQVSFEGCKSLNEIYIPEGIEYIECVKRERTLSTIHVGKNLISVMENAFGFLGDCLDYNDERMFEDSFQQDTIDVLLTNPAYEIVDGFMVNKIHKTTLFVVDSFVKPEMRIPDGIEVIGPQTFNEGIFSSNHEKGLFVKKVVVPASVKKVCNYAFTECQYLTDVIFEGNSNAIEFGDNPFLDCRNFNNDAYENIPDDCKDSKLSNMKLERLVFIHHCFQQGRYMNKNQLQAELMRHFGLAKLGISTITRDLEFLRDRFDAPIEYDFFHKGYHYTEEFELTL